jgi:hypothetical protein
VLVHELNHRVDNEVAAAIGVAFLAATRSGNDKLSAMDRRAGFDARDDAHCSSSINVSSESVGQRKAAKILARTRIFSSAAQLFLGYGIAGVSVEAIANAPRPLSGRSTAISSPRMNSLQNICASLPSGSMSVGQKGPFCAIEGDV